MSHTCHSPVFSSVTTLLAVSESIAEVPHRQVAKRANPNSFRFPRLTIMAEAIAMIQTQRSDNIHGVWHSYQSACKELEVFGSDWQ